MHAFGGVGDHCIIDCSVSRECLSLSAPGDTSSVAAYACVAFTVARSLCLVGLLACETVREGIVNLHSIFQCDLRTLHTAGPRVRVQNGVRRRNVVFRERILESFLKLAVAAGCMVETVSRWRPASPNL
jgi:hypothetical protein